MIDLYVIGFVKDRHVEHVIASKNTVRCLEVPVVCETSIDWENTCVDTIIQTSKRARLTECDVNGLNVEDNLLDVVRVADLVIVEPWFTCGGVVKDCFSTNHVNAREELVARNSGCCNIFSIDVGAGYRVRSIFVEGKLLQGNVVERNTFETVVDSVSTIIVALELKVDVDGGTSKGNTFTSPLQTVCSRVVENVQVGQIDATAEDKIVCVEENVVVAT